MNNWCIVNVCVFFSKKFQTLPLRSLWCIINDHGTHQTLGAPQRSGALGQPRTPAENDNLILVIVFHEPREGILLVQVTR